MINVYNEEKIRKDGMMEKETQLGISKASSYSKTSCSNKLYYQDRPRNILVAMVKSGEGKRQKN